MVVVKCQTIAFPLLLVFALVNGLFVNGDARRCPAAIEDANEALASGANDVIVVRQPDGTLRSTPFYVQVGKLSTWQTIWRSRAGRPIKIFVNGQLAPVDMTISESGSACFARQESPDRLTHAELEMLALKPGRNRGLLTVKTLGIEIEFSIYLYDQNDKFVLTDIDGTITEEDIKGHILPYLGVAVEHDNVVELLSKISSNGYNIVYVTARGASMDEETKDYLFKSARDRGHVLPRGPVFMAPTTFQESLADAFSNPNIAKTKSLREIFALFTIQENVVKGAYGNKRTDTIAYMDAGITPNKIWIVDTDGVLRSAKDGGETSYEVHARRVHDLYPNVNEFQRK